MGSNPLFYVQLYFIKLIHNSNDSDIDTKYLSFRELGLF